MSCTLQPALIAQTVSFHGHSCPGLAIGIRAAELARTRLGSPDGVNLVSVVETDMCGVDAIQFLTGCTFGKGNLIHKDYGKMAFNFFDRKAGKGFRAVLRPEIGEGIVHEIRDLMKKIAAGSATPAEQNRSAALRAELQERYMSAALEDVFDIQTMKIPDPRPARILASLKCADCGEMAMESRTRRFEGQTLCIPCFEKIEQKI